MTVTRDTRREFGSASATLATMNSPQTAPASEPTTNTPRPPSRRRWLAVAAPLVAGIVLILLARIGVAIAGDYDKGDGLWIAGVVGMALVAIGVVALVIFALIRFIVWASR